MWRMNIWRLEIKSHAITKANVAAEMIWQILKITITMSWKQGTGNADNMFWLFNTIQKDNNLRRLCNCIARSLYGCVTISHYLFLLYFFFFVLQSPLSVNIWMLFVLIKLCCSMKKWKFAPIDAATHWLPAQWRWLRWESSLIFGRHNERLDGLLYFSMGM